MEISKEQILELSELFGNDNSSKLRSRLTETLKEWFPKVFKEELEVEKWYKDNYDRLIYITKIIDEENCRAYGFGCRGSYFEDKENSSYWEINGYETGATNEEVETALINEAVKRGFKEGVYFDSPNKTTKDYVSEKLNYNSSHNSLYTDGIAVFNRGIWATIIPTITKEEAEKKLGVKII